MSLKNRPVKENNAETCGEIGYETHKSISSSHGYSSEQPSEEYAIGLIDDSGQIIITTVSCVTLFMDLPKQTVYVC